MTAATLSDACFERIADLIHQRAGIRLTPAKRDMVQGRLGRRLRALGLHSYEDYLRLLDGPETEEWESFTNALTTNLTRFYREPHHFETLLEFLRQQAPGRDIRIWCSASSTGEEPYSIAMTALKAYAGRRVPVKIIASDLDTQVLQQASHGVYRLDDVRDISALDLRKYFFRGVGPNDGLCRVRPELRKLIEFRRLNLLDAQWHLGGRFDAIFCRNVMIYFDKPTQQAIAERMRPLLRPGGLFFAGHSESYFHVDWLRATGRSTYERVDP